MTDKPLCPNHGDVMCPTLDGAHWVCLAPGCRHRIIEPATSEDRTDA